MSLEPTRGVCITSVVYNGWPDSCLISNGRVEAIVVPSIGRVMQFRLAGEENGVFWENRLVKGRLPDPNSDEWANFGGDKSWPAPQADWAKMTGRAWPPPAAFDSSPADAEVKPDGIILTSKVATTYGIRLVRYIRLDPALPQMVITTEYRKTSGDPVTVGIWVITQLRNPERVFALLSEECQTTGAFEQLLGSAPKDLRFEGKLLSLTRDPRTSLKIRMHGNSLLWVDSDYVVRIDAPHRPEECPHNCGRAELYTNPDPVPYVELETVGPLTAMSVGGTIARTNTYTLTRRSLQDATGEAWKAFGLQAR